MKKKNKPEPIIEKGFTLQVGVEFEEIGVIFMKRGTVCIRNKYDNIFLTPVEARWLANTILRELNDEEKTAS